MSIEHYITSLYRQTRLPNCPDDIKRQFDFAKAYNRGEEAVSALRERLIEQEVAKRYTHGAEVRILMNFCRFPNDANIQKEFYDHEDYVQQCKIAVDNNLSSYRSILLANIKY